MEELERWLPVPGFEGLYEASDQGRVKSLRKGVIMSPGSGQDGYPIVSLYGPTGRKGIAVHRLIAEMFVPGRNPLHREVAHLDGVRTNCRASNLKWVSKIENFSHKKLHGTHPSGERHPRAILTNAAVLEIRSSTGRRAPMAEKFGISFHTVTDIRMRRRWRHVGNADAPNPDSQSLLSSPVKE